ncbi:MAG: class I SAM-dependent methyltransferase [Anaerolineae bacterium]
MEQDRREQNKQILRTLVELRGPGIEHTSDSADSYDELHAAGHLRQRDSFYKWIISLLQPQAGQRLLDVSCGQGSVLKFGQEAGLVVAGLDLSSAAVAVARQQTDGQGSLAVANAEQLPYGDDSFDYVTNIGSVEHYARPGQAVAEMARVLRPDGLALILLPNTFGLLGNILYVWRHGDVFDDGQPLQRYGTRAQWGRLLEMNGLRVERTTRYERALPRTWRDLAWFLARPYRLGRALLAPFIPLNLSSFLVYRCRKTSSL